MYCISLKDKYSLLIIASFYHSWYVYFTVSIITISLLIFECNTRVLLQQMNSCEYCYEFAYVSKMQSHVMP